MLIRDLAKEFGNYRCTEDFGFLTCCPFHDDEDDSMYIVDTDNGISFNCKYGCSPWAIFASLIQMLEVKESYPDDELEALIASKTLEYLNDVGFNEEKPLSPPGGFPDGGNTSSFE